MNKKIKKVRIVRQLESHNVAVLKKRFHYYKELKKPYERLAGVLLELHELKYSKLELAAAFLPSKYLHPTTHVANPKGLISLETIIRKLNHDKYKIRYPMLQTYFIVFIGPPDKITGVAEGSYLVTPMTRKTIPEVIKRLEPIYEGIGLTMDRLDELKSKNKRTVEKELERYHREIESKLIREKHKRSRQ